MSKSLLFIYNLAIQSKHFNHITRRKLLYNPFCVKMPISHLLTESFMHEMSSAQSTSNGPLTEPKQNDHFVLIDTDAGSDDAWAIFMAIAESQRNSNFHIVGITTVYGNTTVDNVITNVTRTLSTVGQSAIPVYKGMDISLVSRFKHLEDPPYHGYDGFGDADLPPIQPVFEPEHAVNAIGRLAETYKGKLSIVCLGPLTNVAMALRLYPEMRTQVKDIHILGGNIEGVGNVTVASEFNFYVDPEAAHVVLEGFNLCPIYLVPWETCLKYASSTHAWRVEVLGALDTPQIQLLNAVEEKILDKYTESWLASDAVILACLINPDMIVKTEQYHCSVELHGNHTRGQMIVDRNFQQGKPANVTIISEVDLSVFEGMLMWAAGGPLRMKKN